MKFRPETLGFRVILKPLGVEKVSKGGIDLTAISTRTQAINTDKGEILMIGPDAWDRLNTRPDLKPGDKVMYAKYGAKTIQDPDDQETFYVLLNDEDILVGYNSND